MNSKQYKLRRIAYRAITSQSENRTMAHVWPDIIWLLVSLATFCAGECEFQDCNKIVEFLFIFYFSSKIIKLRWWQFNGNQMSTQRKISRMRSKLSIWMRLIELTVYCRLHKMSKRMLLHRWIRANAWHQKMYSNSLIRVFECRTKAMHQKLIIVFASSIEIEKEKCVPHHQMRNKFWF